MFVQRSLLRGSLVCIESNPGGVHDKVGDMFQLSLGPHSHSVRHALCSSETNGTTQRRALNDRDLLHDAFGVDPVLDSIVVVGVYLLTLM